jgi:hypothetical protein
MDNNDNEHEEARESNEYLSRLGGISGNAEFNTILNEGKDLGTFGKSLGFGRSENLGNNVARQEFHQELADLRQMASDTQSASGFGRPESAPSSLDSSQAQQGDGNQ